MPRAAPPVSRQSSPADLKGGNAGENAAALTALLDGAPGAYRDIVVLNSAAALIVAGMADNLKTGAQLAAEAIDDGRAKTALAELIALTNNQTGNSYGVNDHG